MALLASRSKSIVALELVDNIGEKLSPTNKASLSSRNALAVV